MRHTGVASIDVRNTIDKNIAVERRERRVRGRDRRVEEHSTANWCVLSRVSQIGAISSIIFIIFYFFH